MALKRKAKSADNSASESAPKKPRTQGPKTRSNTKTAAADKKLQTHLLNIQTHLEEWASAHAVESLPDAKDDKAFPLEARNALLSALGDYCPKANDGWKALVDILPAKSAQKLSQALVMVVLARDIFRYVVQYPLALAEPILGGRAEMWEEMLLGDERYAHKFRTIAAPLAIAREGADAASAKLWEAAMKRLSPHVNDTSPLRHLLKPVKKDTDHVGRFEELKSAYEVAGAVCLALWGERNETHTRFRMAGENAGGDDDKKMPFVTQPAVIRVVDLKGRPSEEVVSQAVGLSADEEEEGEKEEKK